MGKWRSRKLHTLKSGLQRYYVLRTLHQTHSRKVNLLLHVCCTLQVLTLAIPLQEDGETPWRYETFWPAWYTLNAIGRPDRVLAAVVGRGVVVYMYGALVLVRTLLAAGWACYYGTASKVEFWKLAKGKRAGCVETYLRKVDSLCLFVLSRLMAVPAVSFLAACLAADEPEALFLSAALLPISAIAVIADRLCTTDLMWQEHNDGPNSGSSALVAIGCDMLAAMGASLCSFAQHDFLLRVALLLCGGVKALYICRHQPFHSHLRNTVEGFSGLALLWEAAVLTLAVSAADSVAPALLVLFGLPLLLHISYSLVTFLDGKSQQGEIATACAHCKALQVAAARPRKPEENEDSLKRHPRLGRLWLHQLDLQGLLWTVYYFLRSEESYFAKVAIAVIACQPQSLLTTVAVAVCMTRAQLQFEESPDELALQNFLSLNHTKERIQTSDYLASVMLRNLYQCLVRRGTSFDHLVMLTHRLSEQMKRTMSLYHKSIETFPKMISLLQAYSGFLDMVGKKSDSERYANLVTKLSQRKKKRVGSAMDRLAHDDPKCVVFVVPLTGPQKGQIVWAVNASAIGYTDENIRGLDHTVLVPEMFKTYHNALEANLIKKRAVPNVLVTAYKMFIVNKDKELLYGTWKVFGTNEKPSGNIVIVATIRLEPPPKEFGILGAYGGLMECTQGFATFARESSFLTACDMHSPDIVWKGEWNGAQLIVSKDEWNIANLQKLPCIALYRIRNRGAASRTLGKMDVRSNQFSSNPESTQLFLSRTSRVSNIETGKTVILGSGEIGYTTQMLISACIQRKQMRLKRYVKLLALALVAVFVAGSVVTMTIGQMYSVQVIDLNSTISSIISIGMRVLSMRTAIRSKELFLLNYNFTLFGNETKAREDLVTAASQFHDMRTYLRGNASSAIGTFRELLLEPITPFWRFEGGTFNIYMMTLLDLMDEISVRSMRLANTSLTNVTAANEDFMTLYRNGAAEALGAFNQSVRRYAESKGEDRDKRLLTLQLLGVLSPFICLSVSTAVLLPLLWLLERWRRQLWGNILAVPREAVAEALEFVRSRLANIHCEESDVFDSTSSSYSSKRKIEYRSSGAMKIFVLFAVVYCTLVSTTGFALYMHGNSTMETILLHKPQYVDWHGMRRAMTVKSWFHMREAWLPARFTFAALIKEHQPFASHMVLWERANSHLHYLQYCLSFGCAYQHMHGILPSNIHKMLMYGQDSTVNDTALRSGFIPLLNELVQLSSAARSDVRSGQTSDYSKGKKVEKYTSLLLLSLTLSNSQMDSDTKGELLAAAEELQRYCILTVCLSFLVLAVAVLPLVCMVAATQMHSAYMRELSVLSHIPKSALLPIANEL